MAKWIIAAGWQAECDIVDCPSFEAAQAKAVERSMAMGLSAEEAGDPDVSWVIPFEEQKALELGLRYEPEVSGLTQAFNEGEKRRTPWR